MNWGGYFEKTQSREPSSLLKKALSLAVVGHALDLGAGALVDSKYLLEQGFDVTAVDSSPQVAEYARGLGDRFHLVTSTFGTYDFPPEAFDLINARYALPFNPPETFDTMFEHLKASLAPGGVFIGEFFGPQDSWAGREGMTFYAKEDVERLLSPLEVLHLEEERKKGTTALGKEKFWHVFHVIAQSH